MTISWLESYKNCSCQSSALKRSKLFPRFMVEKYRRESKLRFDTKAEALAFVNADGDEG